MATTLRLFRWVVGAEGGILVAWSPSGEPANPPGRKRWSVFAPDPNPCLSTCPSDEDAQKTLRWRRLSALHSTPTLTDTTREEAMAMPTAADDAPQPQSSAAAEVVESVLTDARELGLNRAQVVHELHDRAHEYAEAAAEGDPDDQDYVHRASAELRAAARAISAADPTTGTWNDRTFVPTDHTNSVNHATASAPPPPITNRPNMSQYIREPLFPPGYRTQPPA